MFIRLKYIVFIFIFSSFTSFSQELVQNNKTSSIAFKIRNLGFNVAGNFYDFKVLTNFNSKDLKASFLNAEISVKSIFTDSKARDKHLLESDYFDVEKYPKIVFKSLQIEQENNAKYNIKGILTIKGVDKLVEAPLDINASKNGITITANFGVNRKDFDVGGSSFVLSKVVNIKMIYVGNKN